MKQRKKRTKTANHRIIKRYTRESTGEGEVFHKEADKANEQEAEQDSIDIR